MTEQKTKSQIPTFLHGKLYQTLEDDSPFEVPIDLFRDTILIHNIDDFYLYIRIIDYWDVDTIPKEIYEFIFQYDDWENNIPEYFYMWLFANRQKIKLVSHKNNEVHNIIKRTDNRLCDMLAYNGYLNGLKNAHACGYLMDSETLANAAANGQFECFMFAYENRCVIDHKIFKTLVNQISRKGHLDILIFLYEKRNDLGIYIDDSYYKIDPELFGSIILDDGIYQNLIVKQEIEKGWDIDYWNEVTLYASDEGHLHILEYAIKNNFYLHHETCNNAVKKGNLEFIKLACAYECLFDRHIITSAIIRPYLYYKQKQASTKLASYLTIITNLELLTFLHQRGCVLPSELVSIAISIEDMDLLKFTEDNKLIITNRDEIPKLFIQAIKHNNLEIIEYLIRMKYEWNSHIMYLAARGGKLDIIKYAHTHGYPWDSRTCQGAAENGHLNVLKYAHEHGCPWDSNTCIFAVCGNHFDCLVYAHEHGCKWDDSIYKYAKRNNCVKCLLYLRANE